MDTRTDDLQDLEKKVSSREALVRTDAERILACPDLPAVGTLGEAARRGRSGQRITYGRILTVTPGSALNGRGEAVEVRLVGRPSSVDEAQERVTAAAPLAAGATLTGFSLADLLDLVGSDHLALAELAAALRHAGLEAVAEVPLDRLGDTENVVEVIRAVLHGGLGAWRATVERAADSVARLDVIERAVDVQRETSALKAFAPLPRLDDDVTPSTGYDDVRTIAVASAMCPAIPFIQVDWPLYGPKLAQVGLTYGANDVDGIAASDSMALGRRRSPKEDIERQIRAAFAEPMARDGRYGLIA
jgi:hypothetical protein